MRCINLDWLEVYAHEPIKQPRDAHYFLEQGWWVEKREYGTRVYDEMFTLIGTDNYPFIEVRRVPKNTNVLPINAVHIRFVNRSCYYDNAGELMQQFLERYDFEFVSISRVDVCLDFEKFDKGDDPQKFVKRYIGHKYAKINQADAMAHFTDEWAQRDFNSLSWGSRGSFVSTKMYNKTKELYDEQLGAFKKPYILQAWFNAGLIDDPVRCLKNDADGRPYRPVIWRVEFSIKGGSEKGWFTYNPDGDSTKKRSIRNTLDTYQNRQMLLPVFDLLQQHYFHFKKYKAGKRKYDCQDKVLFDFSSSEQFYGVKHPASHSKPDALIVRLIRYLKEYAATHQTPDIHQATSAIINKLEREDAARFIYKRYDDIELQALQQTIALRLSGYNNDPNLIQSDIIHLLTTQQIL